MFYIFLLLVSLISLQSLEPLGSSDCKEIWDNTCTSSNECCSGYCDDHQGQWAQGVCKQNNGRDDSPNREESQSDNYCLISFRKAMLNSHNNYRAQHQVNPLQQNSSIDITAQAYANLLAAKNLFEHSGTEGLGENLAMSSAFNAPSVSDCSSIIISFEKIDSKLFLNYFFNKFL